MFESGGPTLLELIQQALSSTERGYDMIAPKFDKTPFRTPDVILERMARFIGEPRSIDSALDVCCGTGAALRWLRPLCREKVVGVDTSQGMLDEAARRLADEPGLAPVILLRADALDVPFDREFDVATCVGAFGHILEADEPRLLSSIHRALKPGGRFVFATAEMPSALQPAYWMARGFNATMRIRNALIKPEFIMYYLTFMWPAIWRKLERAGFEATAERGLFGEPYSRVVIVNATRKAA